MPPVHRLSSINNRHRSRGGGSHPHPRGNPIALPKGTPIVVPKGNVIGVPTNVADPSRNFQVVHEVKAAVVPVVPVHKVVSAPLMSKGERRRLAKRESTLKPEREREHAGMGHSMKLDERLLLNPGEMSCTRMRADVAAVCDTAFVAYETLYNLTTHPLSVSTLAWGSSLDVSTVRLHYGSTYNSLETKKSCPVASCLTVEMRRYGDRETAKEMLTLRNRTRLDEVGSAFAEGLNIGMRGQVLAMKCLESGHLITNIQSQGLVVWDMKENGESAKVAVARLTRQSSSSDGRLWFDVKRMAACSVDRHGTIQSYDLTNSVSSIQTTATANIKSDSTVKVDARRGFTSSCISRHENEPLMLVGSDRNAQIAIYDARAPIDQCISTTLACLKVYHPNSSPSSWDPVHGVEWNPHREHEFMTISPGTIRIWDRRKMSSDFYAKFHHFGRAAPRIRKAKWSPHHQNIIADHTEDGKVSIWKLDNPERNERPPSSAIPRPERLFLHSASQVAFSDFDWCPHIEDVIATVAPGYPNAITPSDHGCIQVWRPRNLIESEELDEP